MPATQLCPFPDNEVPVWNVNLAAMKPRLADLARLLSCDEQARANRFRFATDAMRFVLAHGALREILALYAQVPATQLRFKRNPFGKPFLTRDAELDLKFNLSYRGERALVAVSRGREIGIDIERFNLPLNIRAMFEFVCSAAEKRALQDLPDEEQTRAFLRLWTRKEAVLKAISRGFSFDARQIEIGFEPKNGVAEVFCDGAKSCWSWREIACSEDYVASIALQNRDATLRFHDFSSA